MKRSSEAALRNRGPIADVLARHVHAGDHVLEIASGSGQHAVYLAEALPVGSWQPTDPDAEARASIDAWRATEGKVRPALALDVCVHPWPVASADVIVTVNMIHISPWEATLGLLDGARDLAPRVLYLYGPYRRGGAHTAPSNAEFDAWLKARDHRFGVRDLEVVVAEAEARGFTLREVAEMPANNLSVVFGVQDHGSSR